MSVPFIGTVRLLWRPGSVRRSKYKGFKKSHAAFSDRTDLYIAVGNTPVQEKPELLHWCLLWNWNSFQTLWSCMRYLWSSQYVQPWWMWKIQCMLHTWWSCTCKCTLFLVHATHQKNSRNCKLMSYVVNRTQVHLTITSEKGYYMNMFYTIGSSGRNSCCACRFQQYCLMLAFQGAAWLTNVYIFCSSDNAVKNYKQKALTKKSIFLLKYIMQPFSRGFNSLNGYD